MGTHRVAILDYGMGNLHSVASALQHVAPTADIVISSDPAVIDTADRLIFPGVGAIRDCMAEIKHTGFDKLVPQLIESGRPMLGICVGMQALMTHSEENGGVDCLGQLEGDVKFFGHDHVDANGTHLKVPHMGWNRVQHRCDHPLWEGIENGERFYFVHSYYVKARTGEVMGTCDYGVVFDAAVGHNNLFAVQFHPEKSHTVGLKLLSNFVHWNGQP